MRGRRLPSASTRLTARSGKPKVAAISSTLRPSLTKRTKLSHCVTSSGSSRAMRSEEHTSELQSLMRNSYAVFCLKKKNRDNNRRLTEDIHPHMTLIIYYLNITPQTLAI